MPQNEFHNSVLSSKKSTFLNFVVTLAIHRWVKLAIAFWQNPCSGGSWPRGWQAWDSLGLPEQALSCFTNFLRLSWLPAFFRLQWRPELHHSCHSRLAAANGSSTLVCASCPSTATSPGWDPALQRCQGFCSDCGGSGLWWWRRHANLLVVAAVLIQTLLFYLSSKLQQPLTWGSCHGWGRPLWHLPGYSLEVCSDFSCMQSK